jgi:hypothetical protein
MTVKNPIPEELRAICQSSLETVRLKKKFTVGDITSAEFVWKGELLCYEENKTNQFRKSDWFLTYFEEARTGSSLNKVWFPRKPTAIGLAKAVQ